jgi:hypothetical protein
LRRESKITDEVRSYALDLNVNPFAELFASVRFEDVGKGRQGAVLVKLDETGHVPLVRTTTRFIKAAQRFLPIHEQLAEQIQTRASISSRFNNALIETYTNASTTMGSHSDQALDLADDSFIAVFSCYEHPERANPPRTLIIEEKEPSDERAEIALAHNHVVVFSVDSNRRLKHKIVLNATRHTPENRWLGITCRTSKTFVRYRASTNVESSPMQAHFLDDTCLTLANEEQRREFYHLRSRENHEIAFVYPWISYTISESDLMAPVE